MSASDSDGIRTLLESETAAQQHVQEARQFRAERLKAAKADAKTEIEKYKQAKEEEFQKIVSEFGNSETGDEKLVQHEANKEIDALRVDAKKGRDKVLDMLIKKAISA